LFQWFSFEFPPSFFFFAIRYFHRYTINASIQKVFCHLQEGRAMLYSVLFLSDPIRSIKLIPFSPPISTNSTTLLVIAFLSITNQTTNQELQYWISPQTLDTCPIAFEPISALALIHPANYLNQTKLLIGLSLIRCYFVDIFFSTLRKQSNFFLSQTAFFLSYQIRNFPYH
jgi:hypothetical protein